MSEERKYYSETEKMLLCSLIEDHKDIVECKKTDGASIRQKSDIWEKITKLYNSHDVCKRNSKQLKKFWENLKQKARKAETKRKYEMLQTGGGPLPNEDNNPILERVRSIVPTIDFEIKNSFDSIGIMKNDENQQVSFDEEEGLEMPTAGPSHDHCYGYDQTNIEKKDVLPKTKNRKLFSEISSKEYVIEEADSEKENVSSKKQRKLLPNNILKECAREESELRKQKLQESIQQQRELHNMKMDAALEEKKYWETKTNLLKK